MASVLPRSFSTSAFAAAIASWYFTQLFGFASIVTPMSPMRTVRPAALTGTIADVGTPGNGWPPASVTFVETSRNFACARWARNAASDTSNSWLPNVAQSTPVAFRTSTMCRPAIGFSSTIAVPSAEGDR